MERSDTLPFLPDLLEEYIKDSSFNDRLTSSDCREIFSVSDDQNSSSLELWNDLDNDANNMAEDVNVKIEMVSEPPKFVPLKKVVTLGDEVYLIEEGNGCQLISEENSGEHLISPSVTVIDSNSTSPTSFPAIPSLSLQPWKGDFNFTVGVETATYSNSKWAYSATLKKLFLRPFDAVPIEVKVSSWISGYINITPVYKSSQYTSQPVNRCYNHKISDEEKNLPYFEHIVQVDNTDAMYRVDGLRHSVDIPLGTPAPGENSKLLYVKCGCWNTCTGGPNRKPFCLVFTLFSSIGEEIGRQILDLKVCACPIRDCGYSEKNQLAKLNPGKTAGKVKPVVRKKSSVTSKAAKKIKAEPDEQSFEQISIPSEIAGEVKRFINQLMAEKYAKENNVYLPFPDC